MGFVVNQILRNPCETRFVIDRKDLLSYKPRLTQRLVNELMTINSDLLVCKIIKLHSSFNTPNSYGVKFEDFENSQSSYGCFWIHYAILINMFENGTLRYEKEIKNNINNKEEIIMEDFKVVKISFCEGSNTSSVYPYALIDDIELTVGDLVVVKPAHHPITLARVVGFENEPSANDVHFASQGREIINKVDTSAYEQRIKNRKRKAELKREMDKLVSENKELVLYAAVAENNPKMAELLNEYKNLI